MRELLIDDHQMPDETMQRLMLWTAIVVLVMPHIIGTLGGSKSAAARARGILQAFCNVGQILIQNM